MRKLSLNSLSF